MKKFIAVVAALVLFSAGVASAVVVRNINKSRMTRVNVSLSWNNDFTEIQWITLNAEGVTLDDTGRRAGTSLNRFDYDDLSPQLQVSLKNVIKFLGKELSVKAVDENVEPSFSATMQRPGSRRPER